MAKSVRRRLPAVLVSLLLASLLLVIPFSLTAENAARFDLQGPSIDIHVTRNNVTLPIAEVPNLQPGDKIFLHPDLPATQSVKYLLIVAFLRGTTNPPPDDWFTRIECWNKHVREEGVTVTVPPDAQQALLFLAPETGGDFSTLRSAVKGRPGIFVRASQDLTESGFEQSRIERYIAGIKMIPAAEASDPKALAEHSSLLARTLALKPNDACAKLSPDQQLTCLALSGNQNLLDDGHGQSVAQALTNGASSDLINQASTTSLAAGGLYSAYVGAIVDLVRLTSSLHTAQYQYIPAIAFPQKESLNLKLNTAPSFHNPKSVIVIGLPAILASVPPPLRAADPRHVSCLLQPDFSLPLEGAPLVFSTSLAHDLVLHLDTPTPSPDLSLEANAFRGGLVLGSANTRSPIRPAGAGADAAVPQSSTTASTPPSAVTASVNSPSADAPIHPAPGQITGTIHGFWGFDPFTGPTILLQNVAGKGWQFARVDPQASSDGQISPNSLIAGQKANLLLTAEGTGCIERIQMQSGTTSVRPQDIKVEWKPAEQPDTVAVAINVPASAPSDLNLTVHQYGEDKPSIVALKTYSAPATLTSLEYHAGDNAASLTGTHLDQVKGVEIAGISFEPEKSNDSAGAALEANDDSASHTDANNGTTTLKLEASSATPVKPSKALAPGKTLTASVTLLDARVLPLSLTIGVPRPSVTLLSRNLDHNTATPITLAGDDDLPSSHSLTFSLRSEAPFKQKEQIEIANQDQSLKTTLSLEKGLILQDPHTILATLDPLKAFGPSAYGPLSFRPISAEGTPGEWLPLVHLVRLPNLTELHCPAPGAASRASGGRAGSRGASSRPLAAPAPLPLLASASPLPQTLEAPKPSEVPSSPSSAPNPAIQPASPTATAASASPGSPSGNAVCTLTGSSLFLVQSLSAEASFSTSEDVPEGFVGSSIAAPRPVQSLFYLKLRDDPTSANPVTLPVLTP